MNWLVCVITLSSIFQDCSFASFSVNDTILFNNLLLMQPQEKETVNHFHIVMMKLLVNGVGSCLKLLTPRRDASLASIGPDGARTVCNNFI